MTKKPVKKVVKKPAKKKVVKKPAPKPEPVPAPFVQESPVGLVVNGALVAGPVFDEPASGWVDPLDADLEAQAAAFNDVEDVIDSVDMGIVHVKNDSEVPLSFADRVDKDQTIVYVIDESGSMGMSRMEPEQQGYNWTPEVLEKFQHRILTQFEDESFNEEGLGKASSQAAALRWLDEGLDNPDNLARYILDNDLLTEHSDIVVSQKQAATPPTRNECMKEAMKKFVEQRFNKYPGSKVAVIGFTDFPTVRCEAGANKVDVLSAINALRAAGGTHIYDAVVAGLNQVAKSPSPMRANHIILVSDGEDSSAGKVEELLPHMRTNDIVFDFIFIKGYNSRIDPDIRKMLEKITRQTGGDYFEVTRASDFEQKFFEVSHRLCLPVGR